MRKLMTAAALMLAIGTANAGNVFVDMFRYECKHASAEKEGFTCSTRQGVMTIHLAHDPKTRSADENERTAYQLSKLLKTYHSMPDPLSRTGRASRFYITAAYWPKTRIKTCSFILTQLRAGGPSADRYTWTCRDSK